MATGDAEVIVNLHPVDPVPVPEVNAGLDQMITLPTSSINFIGTASAPVGTIATVSWSQLSGPSSAVIANA